MSTDRRNVLFNEGWLFTREDAPGAETVGFDDSRWEQVCLPHTPKIETVDVIKHFQGICFYRKRFKADESFRGKKIYIEFEAAMQVAQVWINGVHKLTHMGGYLPFTIDISDIFFDRENVIAVRLDNSDNPDVPPGKPLGGLDFSYFGGLYRNVRLYAVNPVHITDAVYANKTASGGVFVTYENVTEKSAKVRVKTHAVNDGSTAETVTLTTALTAPNGGAIKGGVLCEVVQPGAEVTFEQVINVENPLLWHPEHPHLYTLKSTVCTDGGLSDGIDTAIGIRTISYSKQDGFVINGERLWILGANRHQQYPYIGNAASDNAQFREVKKLKDAGFNFLRLAHYPQSPAFIDACDRLGLMLVEPTPGWQFCNEGIFKDIVLQNISDMIRRDRNHPSIIMWEVSLNETGDTDEFKWDVWCGATDEFYRRCNELAHEEYPGGQMYTSGDTLGRRNPDFVGFDIQHTGWDEYEGFEGFPELHKKPGFAREYGDFEFGGNHSTTRQVRENGEKALLLSAWNFQWKHNNIKSRGLAIGDAIWVGIDYNRGYFPTVPLCTSGVMDIFRCPKFSYYFYQSQRDAAAGAMVYIANYWTGESTKVIVYSNCDEVALYLNGRLLERRTPDSGPDSEYMLPKTLADPAYWMEQKSIEDSVEGEVSDFISERIDESLYFDGGNCENLDHAPFTFTNVAFEKGELTAIGYIDGNETARDVRITPEEPAVIEVCADAQGRELSADGADFVFVHALIKDKNGTVVPWSDELIRFEAEGDAVLVGENPTRARAGIASIILKAGLKPGTVKIHAVGGALEGGTISCQTV